MTLEEFTAIKTALEDDHAELQSKWASFTTFSPERRPIAGKILANRAALLRLFNDHPEHVEP